MSIEEKHLKINIYNENKEQIEKSKNQSESYLILSNEELNNKLRDAINDISEMNAEKLELENDNERMEKSITYQRGLLHNFNGLNKLYEKKIKIQSDILKQKSDYILNFKNKYQKFQDTMFYNMVITLLFNLLIILMVDNKFIQLTMINIISLSSFKYLPQVFNCRKDDFTIMDSNFDNKEKVILPKLTEIQEEIDLIKGKNDFISDLIDEA